MQLQTTKLHARHRARTILPVGDDVTPERAVSLEEIAHLESHLDEAGQHHEAGIVGHVVLCGDTVDAPENEHSKGSQHLDAGDGTDFANAYGQVRLGGYTSQ